MMATFNANFGTVERAANSENSHFATPYPFVIVANGDGTATIKGPPQFVMYVIGAMAASGEDSLLAVSVHP